MLLKILSLFSGIGAFEKALTNLNIEHEIVAWSEIDKFASKGYELLHNPKGKNWGDITKIDETKLPKFDLMTYGFPCQDISVAGKQKGIELGTRSGLLYEALRILQYHRPEYAIAENVKNLVGKRHIDNFKALLTELEFYGYNSYWKVLNSKNYGVPQNRERVFIISIRKDVDDGEFEFPIPFDNGIRLKDILEDEVEEKFYINSKKVKNLLAQLDISTDLEGIDLTINKPKTRGIANCIKARYDAGISNFMQDGTGVAEAKILQVGMLDIKGNEQVRRVYDEEGISPTLNTMQGGNRQPKVAVKEATTKGFAIATEGDSINIQFPNSKTRRGRVGKEVAQTLETSCNQGTLTQDYRIRKLTPTECWLLQGFTKEDIRKCIDIGISNSQLYKQAGNSITVNVLEEIFKKLF